jgi:hypothetical protein
MLHVKFLRRRRGVLVLVRGLRGLWLVLRGLWLVLRGLRGVWLVLVLLEVSAEKIITVMLF